MQPRRGVSPAVIFALIAVIAVGGAAAYVRLSSSRGPATDDSGLNSSPGPSATTSSTVNSTQDGVNMTRTTTVASPITSVSYTTTQFLSPGVNDVVQSCGAFGDRDQNVSCMLPFDVAAGHILLVEIAEVPESYIVGLYNSNTTETQISDSSATSVASLYDSMKDNFSLIGSATQSASTYRLYFYVANVTSSGNDTVSLSGVGNYPFLLVHELHGVTHVAASSTGSGNSTTPSVTPYSPPTGSFVFSGIFVWNSLGVPYANISAGAGSVSVDETYGLADQYSMAQGGSIASPFALTNAIPWGEVSIAFD
ncbi:MAG: hypothetical protein OK449_10730 [Thaumarchaeota archaeon]|nr:hypothetical protein [Nitrososphaerota archaeon]